MQQLKINGAVTAPFHEHQIVIKIWVCGNRALHSAFTLWQKIKGAIIAPLHPHQIGCAATMQLTQHAHYSSKSTAVTAPFHGHQIVVEKCMGARRPRISFSMHATAKNQGRDHRALPSAPDCSQKLGARRPRTSCSMHSTVQIQRRCHCAFPCTSDRS